MATSRSLGKRVVDDGVADLERARGDLFETREHPQRGRLAAARGPDEHHELAVVDVQARSVDGRGSVAEDLGHAVEVDLSHASALLWLGGLIGRCPS